MASWFARLCARVSRKRAAVRVEGACKMSGSCCRNLILVDRGRPLGSLRRFRRLARRDREFRMFVPREEVPGDGLLRFRCQNLAVDGHCQIHPRRPEFCRDYPSIAMFERGGSLLTGCGYRLIRGASDRATFEDAFERALAQSNPSARVPLPAFPRETGTSR